MRQPSQSGTAIVSPWHTKEETRDRSTDGLTDRQMLLTWWRAAKKLATVFTTWVHIVRSASRWILRSWTKMTGSMWATGCSWIAWAHNAILGTQAVIAGDHFAFSGSCRPHYSSYFVQLHHFNGVGLHKHLHLQLLKAPMWYPLAILV